MDRQAPDSGATGLRRRGWLLAFLGFFMCIGAWALASPYNGTPDEEQHILRAVTVVAGQVFVAPAKAVNGGGGYVNAPASLVRPGCWQFSSGKSAACAPEPGGDRTIIRTGSGAARYHPIYYAVVGVPLRLSPDWTGVLVARLISGMFCAALLATALMDAMRWSRHRLMAAGVLAGVTPMATHMAGAVNPNGVEIAAGVAFFAAAVPLLIGGSGARSRTLLWHAGVAALALAVLRAGGPLWLMVSIGALLMPLRWAKVRELWRWPEVRWWTLALGVAMVGSVVWSALFKTTDLGDFTHGQQLSPFQAVKIQLDLWRQYADEMVGITSWLDARMPAAVYLVWESAAAALLVWGFVLGNRAGRWRLIALVVGGIGLPFAMQVAYVNKYGFVTQGRYLLPVIVGLPIIATFLIQEYGLPADKSRFLLRLYAVVLLPIHLVSLFFTMIRWQRGLSKGAGLHSLNPFSGTWLPPLGPVVPLLAAIAGLVLVGWLVWRIPAQDRQPLPSSAQPHTASDGTRLTAQTQETS